MLRTDDAEGGKMQNNAEDGKALCTDNAEGGKMQNDAEDGKAQTPKGQAAGEKR